MESARAPPEDSSFPTHPPPKELQGYDSILEQIRTLVTASQNPTFAGTGETASWNEIRQDFLNLKTEILERMDRTEQCFDRVPMCLYNSRIPFNCPLRYPQGITVVPPMPIYKRDICNLLESDCAITASVLRLPPLPEDATVQDMRNQIRDFLGAF
ncbi:hypothetical protein H0H93_009285 [Arthromyces matolae]|nr:hypothetical protein H0H93_009285 [Arthromyces matolae]